MHESLGDILKNARSTSGLSIEDVASRTKIPRPAIQALEAEDFGYFTSPLYARSFLKQYSEYIGADVDHWLADFVPTVMIDSDSVESILGSPETPSEHPASIETEKNMSAIWGSIWIFLITVAIIWAGVKIFEKLDSEHTETEQYIPPEESEQSASEESTQLPAENLSNDSDAPKRALNVDPETE
jgi:cytoskeletal protein RodZ